MSVSVASAFVSIEPDTKGFGSKLNSQVGGQVGSSGKSIGSKFGAAFKVGAAAAVGGALLAVGFLKGALGEAREAQKVGKLTNAVIKSTGGVAGVTAKDVDKLSTALSLKTGVDDEAIAAGQNMLLTFTNVRNEVGKGNDIFDRATTSAQDMAAAFGGDAVSNSKMLGKALNDPTAGVSALTRVGVSFTQQQKDQIKAMQESGDMLGAQKVILGEVSKQTEGAAESQATAGDKFKTAFANLQESIGAGLLPILDKGLNGLTALIGAFQKGGLGKVVEMVGEKIKAALPIIQAKLSEWGTAFVAWVQVAGPPLLQKLGGLLVTIYTWLFTVAYPALVAKLVQWGKAFVEWIGPQIPPMLAKLGELAARLYAWLIDVGLPRLLQNLKKWGEAFLKWVGPMIPPMLVEIGKLLGKLVAWLLTTGLPKLLGALLKLGVALFQWIAPQVPKVLVAIGGLLAKLGGWIISTGLPMLASKLREMGEKGFQALKEAAQKKAGEFVEFVKTIPDKVKAVFSGAATMLVDAGQQLMSGLAAGIRAKIDDAINEVKAGLSKIRDMLPGSPIKDGPLKGWNGGTPGKKLMEMLADGMAIGGAAVQSEMTKVLEKLESQLDTFKGKLSSLRSDFASISEGVASSLTGNLFEASNTTDFLASLTGTSGTLGNLTAAFKKLTGLGFDKGFLAQLFQSGNAALILDLAAVGNEGTAADVNALFGGIQTMSTNLGDAVASSVLTERMTNVRDEIKELRKDIQQLAPEIGKALNGAATNGHKKGKRT